MLNNVDVTVGDGDGRGWTELETALLGGDVRRDEAELQTRGERGSTVTG